MKWFVSAVAVAAVLASADAAADDATPAPDKSAYTLFNPTPISALRSFSTDRPDKSTSPYTVDAGHFQYETDLFGYSYDGYNHAGGSTREFFMADPVLKLGVTNFADVEIALGGYQTYQFHSRSGGSHDYDGFGDVTLRTKVNVLGNDSGKLAIALDPFFKVPTATRGLGDTVGEFGLTIPVQYTLPYNFTALIVTEFDDFKNGFDTGRHAGFTNVINLSYPVTANITAALEFYSQVQAAHIRSFYTIDIALSYLLSPNTQLDTAAYVGLNKAAPDIVGYVGVSQRF